MSSDAATLIDSPATGMPRWVHRLAFVTTVSTFVLICAGGHVKSKGAGLSVPGWPFSYGQPNASIAGGIALVTLGLALAWATFKTRALAVAAIVSGACLACTFYIFGPVGHWYKIPNLRAEHGHRLIAGTVGFLMAILAGALWRTESRKWVQKLGACALLAVILQAILGGITVRYFLPPWVSASHGMLAQGFFGLVSALAVVTSPTWLRPVEALTYGGRKNPRKMAVMMMGAIYLQIMLGSALRHTPYIPGKENVGIFTLHLIAHLLGLLFVAHTSVMMVLWVNRNAKEGGGLQRWAAGLAGLIFLQVLLGIGSLLIRFLPVEEVNSSFWRASTTTAHVAVGALILGCSVALGTLVLRATQNGPSPDPSGQTSSKESKSSAESTSASPSSMAAKG